MNEMANRGEAGLPRLRDMVIEELTGQFALDRLSMNEFERRVEAANASQTRAGLESLIADLPPLPAEKRETTEVDLPYRVNKGTVQETGSSFCVFSGAERQGVWAPPRHLSNICVFGGAKIDLREAELPPDGMIIDVVCVFGGVDVIIPEGVNVSVQGMGIFGGFSRRNTDRQYPGAPTITVRGIAVFGGADVKVLPSRKGPRR